MFRPMTSHLATRLQHTSDFGGVVYDVGEFPIIPASQPPPAPQPKPESLRVQIVARLSATAPGTRKLKNQKIVLIAEANEYKVSLGEMDQFLADCEAEVVGVLRSQHYAIRTKGRQQLALCEQLNAEFMEANQSWNYAGQEKEKAIEEVRQAQRRRNRLESWAWSTDAERKAADEMVSEAQELARVSIQSAAADLQARNTAEQKLTEARAELVRLTGEERRYRKMLSGESYTDPEFGLEVPARA